MNAMLPQTNITMVEYAQMLEHSPVAIHQLRRDLNIADHDLVEEWISQIEWMTSQIDNAYGAADRAMRTRLMRALFRMIWPFFLLNFALRFPRLSTWPRIA